MQSLTHSTFEAVAILQKLSDISSAILTSLGVPDLHLSLSTAAHYLASLRPADGQCAGQRWRDRVACSPVCPRGSWVCGVTCAAAAPLAPSAPRPCPLSQERRQEDDIMMDKSRRHGQGAVTNPTLAQFGTDTPSTARRYTATYSWHVGEHVTYGSPENGRL